MPEVVIVDEIGTEAEALACRSIAERGVQLIGTAHGQILENLMKNPTLSDLIGGIQSVTLGAQPARIAKCKWVAEHHMLCLQKLVSALIGSSLLFFRAFYVYSHFTASSLGGAMPSCPCYHALASPRWQRRR